MATQYAFGRIVTHGLVLALDAADRNSYVSGSTTWNDLSGNSANGTFVGAVTGSSSAISFPYNTGSAIAYVNVPNSSVLQNTGNTDFTVSTWFAFNSSYLAGNRNLIEKPDNSVNPGWSIWFDATTLRVRLAYTGNYVDIFGGPSSAFIPGSFYNLVMVISRTNSLCYWYNNGALLISGSISALGDMTNTVSIRIGAGTVGFGHDTFGGNIPSVLMYNRALSATEIQQNYNAQKARFGLT